MYILVVYITDPCVGAFRTKVLCAKAREKSAAKEQAAAAAAAGWELTRPGPVGWELNETTDDVGARRARHELTHAERKVLAKQKLHGAGVWVGDTFEAPLAYPATEDGGQAAEIVRAIRSTSYCFREVVLTIDTRPGSTLLENLISETDAAWENYIGVCRAVLTAALQQSQQACGKRGKYTVGRLERQPVSEVRVIEMSPSREWTVQDSAKRGDLGYSCFWTKYVESAIDAAVAQTAPEDAAVIDGGGHNGETLTLFARAFHDRPATHFHVFEPSPGNIANIQKVAASFPAFHNITVNQKALVGDSAVNITMHCSSPDCSDEHTTASVALGAAIAMKRSEQHDGSGGNKLIEEKSINGKFSIDAPAVRLDDYLRSQKPPVVPYFVKLDLQGLDFEVVWTLGTLTPPVPFIAWEYMYMPPSGRRLSVEVNYLISRGYDVYRILPGNMYRNFRAQPGNMTFHRDFPAVTVDARPIPDALLKLEIGFEAAEHHYCCRCSLSKLRNTFEVFIVLQMSRTHSNRSIESLFEFSLSHLSRFPTENLSLHIVWLQTPCSLFTPGSLLHGDAHPISRARMRLLKYHLLWSMRHR
jgi:FkbM family methyltransferase